MGRQMWTLEEDELLRGAIDHGGARRWVNIAEHVPGKTAKQCRSRWFEQIGPYKTDDPWTEAEYLVLVQLVSVEGRRWAIISQQMLGRTANDVKNKYNSLVNQGRAPYILSAPRTPKAVCRERKQKHSRRQQQVTMPSTPQTQKIEKKEHGGTKFTIGSSKISLTWDWW